MSGESSPFRLEQDDLSGESNSTRKRDRILSGVSGNITDKLECNDVESAGSSDDSRTQSWENTSETSSNSDVSEIAIQFLLVEWKQRRLDREIHQDPDRDRPTWNHLCRRDQPGTIPAGSNTFEEDMVCQVDG